MADKSEQWSLYIVRCVDGSLYTGITNDLERRVQQHNLGQGAKYTRGRGPVELAYTESYADRSEASKREYAIKQMSLRQKLQLILARMKRPD
ncbi:MAG: GIY-YIG nuclease family protein [Chromatiales bacterium]|jgi:putative endonuclease